MQRFVRYLKDMFAPMDPERFPTTSFEMTLHDALRICAGPLRKDDGAALTSTASRPVNNVCWYRSESDLHAVWRYINEAPLQTAHYTVVLVLGNFLRSNLRDLIRRCPHGRRLIIVPQPGLVPEIDSLRDLTLAADSLGWKEIELCREMHVASDASAFGPGQDERLLIVLPETTPTLPVI